MRLSYTTLVDLSFPEPFSTKAIKIRRYLISADSTTRFFVCSPYSLNESTGKFECETPDKCPLGITKGNHEACKIACNHHRNRKTGPRIPLAVLECNIHNSYFTVYPPGHVPYGRKALVSDIALDGCHVKSETEETSDLFGESLFDAPLRASQGVFYPKEGSCDPFDSCYDTQLNHIKKAALILGILPEDKAPKCIHIMEILNLPHSLQAEPFSCFSDQEWDYRKTSQLICNILSRLPADKRFERLVACGALSELWPSLCIWNPDTKKLYESTYCRRVKAYKTGSADRAPPP